MPTNIILIDAAFRLAAANDNGPVNPGGAVVSIAAARRRARIHCTLRGLTLGRDAIGMVLAA